MMISNAVRSPQELAQYIDHTLLRKDATEPQIHTLCQEAVEFAFKSVCVEAVWVPLAIKLIQGKGPLICTVISFPSGEGTPGQKAKEAKRALELGASEFDMVLNRKYLAERNFSVLYDEIHSVVAAVQGHCVKVILETSELSEIEKVLACGVARAAGAQFVKTSTGFSKSGATVEDIRLMRDAVGPLAGVKASGGVRTAADAVKMIEAGASRIGASASVNILREFQI